MRVFRDSYFRTCLRALVCAVLAGTAACSVYDPELTQSRQNAVQVSAGRGASDASSECGQANGSCARAHASATCVNGVCLIVSCDTPYADCDDNPDNGCEADLSSTDHCGLCYAACNLNHARARCDNGRCTLDACESGYESCDDNGSNGCERGINSVRDCGKCNLTCGKPAHGTAGCNAGQCGVGQCEPGFGDCNGNPRDGCEQALTDIAHCGSCQSSCQLPHVARSLCENGSCVVRGCEPGWEDCNGKPEDGCEADLASAATCGVCGRACALPHVSRGLCSAVNGTPQCQIDKRCDEGQGSCDSSLRGCQAGYADCDGKPENGCETPLDRLNSCGSCGKSCVEEHASSACENGRCVVRECDPGYARCADGGACQSLLSDPKNCGACGKVCDGATPQCTGGRCTAQSCGAERADCDAQANNACETSLNDTRNCGGCGIGCATRPHASASCQSGQCRLGPCESGWADCDGDARNGCEVALDGLDDCGACNKPCSVAHGEARCAAGTCQVARCEAGREDCNDDVADGCEVDLSLPDNCGSCGTSCRGLPNVAASSCSAEGCGVQCANQRADCDRQLQNGCEADLSAAQSCGGCGRDCTALSNVTSARCQEGSCRELVCEAGSGDCNDEAADGCERSLRTASDCGACDAPCAPAHAQADCSTGKCRASKCDSGYGDCDGDAKNGCETLLSSSQHCGACGKSCAGGARCTNGTCGCIADEDCGSGQACCEGKCVSTAGTCFPWPCIPGTDLSANRANCGGCGALCLTWCCGALL